LLRLIQNASKDWRYGTPGTGHQLSDKTMGEKNMRVDLLSKLLFHFLFERHALALEGLPGSGHASRLSERAFLLPYRLIKGK
jgi:hypothetical protein